MSFVNYLKYSGASVTMTVNPCHWAWVPVFSIDEDWDFETYRFSILFLTVRFWLDDGSW